MPYVLDAVIAIIVIVCVVRGARKGFIRAAFGILTFLLAAVLAFFFYGPFSDFVIATPAGQSVESSLYDSVYKAVAGNAAETPAADDEAESAVDTPAQQPANTTEGLLNAMKIPQFMYGTVFAQSDFLVRTAQLTVAEAVSRALTSAFMKAMAGILLFLLLLIGIWLLRIVLEMIFKLPLLKEVNRLAGFLAGLVNGVLLSYLVLAVLGSLSGFGELSFVRDTIAQSYIYKNFYETNILWSLFTK